MGLNFEKKNKNIKNFKKFYGLEFLTPFDLNFFFDSENDGIVFKFFKRRKLFKNN
jgi:hypothetical protein